MKISNEYDTNSVLPGGILPCNTSRYAVPQLWLHDPLPLRHRRVGCCPEL
nr:MAG TPA: hypothetical protein [Caudoviricetes sp.]